MTELQMGLIGLGATAVVGVLAYNKWQEYRHRKLAEAVLKPQHDDVLLGRCAEADAAGCSQRAGIARRSAGRCAERLEPVLADEPHRRQRREHGGERTGIPFLAGGRRR